MCAASSEPFPEDLMAVYWLSAAEGNAWLSPEDVVNRLRAAFDHVLVDRDAGQALAQQFLAKYRKLEEAGLGVNAIPLREVERQWSVTLLVQAWDDSGPTARFQTVVRVDHYLQLHFAPKTASVRKRRTIKKVADALGYRAVPIDAD
jgi:hypothetical protein